MQQLCVWYISEQVAAVQINNKKAVWQFPYIQCLRPPLSSTSSALQKKNREKMKNCDPVQNNV